MLASLLPGFREARVALAAGYLHLLSLYVLLREPLARVVAQDADVRAAVRTLQDVFGDVGIGAAVTFVALLAGSVASDVTNGVLVRPGRRYALSPRGHAALAAVGAEVGRQAAVLSSEKQRELLTDDSSVVTALRSELPFVRTRLLAEDRDLFGEVDRLEAEAEFRVAVGVALVTLATATAVGFGPYWALGLLPGLVLTALGRVRSRDAGDLLADALLLKRVRAPFMDRLEAELDSRPGRPVSQRRTPRSADSRNRR